MAKRKKSSSSVVAKAKSKAKGLKTKVKAKAKSLGPQDRAPKENQAEESRRESRSTAASQGSDYLSAGTISVFVAYQNGDGVAVLTNGEQGGTLAAEVVQTVARVYGWADFQPIRRSSVALPPGALEGLAGTYRDSSGSTQLISRLKGGLFLAGYPGRTVLCACTRSPRTNSFLIPRPFRTTPSQAKSK